MSRRDSEPVLWVLHSKLVKRPGPLVQVQESRLREQQRLVSKTEAGVVEYRLKWLRLCYEQQLEEYTLEQ